MRLGPETEPTKRRGPERLKASWPRNFVAYVEREERSMPSFFILLRRVLG